MKLDEIIDIVKKELGENGDLTRRGKHFFLAGSIVGPSSKKLANDLE